MLNFSSKLLLFTSLSLFTFASLVPAPAWARGAPSLPGQSEAQNENAPQSGQPLTQTEVALAKEVRHVLVMQPFYTVFDNLEFKVNGEEVTLMGQVVKPVLRSNAAGAVMRLQGVTSVKNEIQVLPPSPSDTRIRLAMFRAIYSAPGFQRYAIQAVPPIHIIVNLGRVTLTGIVANQMDKTIALSRANQVPGVIGKITDRLRVENEGGS